MCMLPCPLAVSLRWPEILPRPASCTVASPRPRTPPLTTHPIGGGEDRFHSVMELDLLLLRFEKNVPAAAILLKLKS